MNRQKKQKIKIETIVELGLLIALLPVLYQMFIIEEVIRGYINKPSYYCNFAYYQCGGTKKNPKFCPIVLKERINEDD